MFFTKNILVSSVFLITANEHEKYWKEKKNEPKERKKEMYLMYLTE